MPIATRLANTGSLLVNNSVDEVSMVAGSISFNGTSQYLTTPVNTGFDMGTGDFTIECFVINLGYSGSQYGRGLFTIYPGASYNQRFMVRMNSGSNVMNMYAYNGTTAYLGNSGTNGTALLSDSTKWYHIAVVRQSGVFRLYVNGVQDIIVSDQTSESLPTSCVIEVGRNQDGTVPYWNGLISNFRVVKGTAVYTGAFTPPQAILPAITNTQLLLNTMNSTDFIKDNSPNALTLTNNGTASFTANSPFGINTTGAISFYGSQYLTLPSNQIQFSMSTGDFTIECWVNVTSLAATRTIYDTVNGGDVTGTGRFGVQISTGGVVQIFTLAGTILTSGGTLVAGTWYHIAYVKISNSGKLYLNGTQVNTTYTDNNNYVVGTTSRPVIGINGYDLSSNPMLGFITNLRVVKGTGVYTAAFTPAGPLYPITNTSFLLNVTSSASLVTDSSVNNFTVTNSGATFAASRPSTGFLLPQQRVTSSGTMEVTDQFDEVTLRAGSLFFISSPYLTLPSNQIQFSMSTGDFTFECWVYVTSLAVARVIYDTVNGGDVTGTGRFGVQISTGGVVQIFTLAGTILTSGGTVLVNNWYHIAYSRNSASSRLYLNGIQVNTTYADTNNFVVGTVSRPIIGINGYDASSNPFLGYITNLRLVKGTGLYPNPFTPPQSILPAVANTSLLLNMATSTNRTTDSSSNNFTVTNNGTVQWSGSSPYNQTNTVPPASTTPGSVLFNGTSQYLSVPGNAAFQFTGDFTVECWIYLTKVTGYQSIFGQYPGPGVFGWLLQMNNGSTMRAIFNNSASTGAISASTAIAVNNWYHVALTRSGTACTLWFNGTSVGTSTLSGTVGTATDAVWIGNGGSTDYTQGYITNARVVDGTAVYTAAFAPPIYQLTAIANTSLLLNATTNSTLTTDSSSNNFTVTNNGTATYSSLTPISPGSNPNGAGSVLFNGSSQYLSLASNAAFAFDTGNFTIECWFYSSSIASTQGIYDTRTPTDTANAGYDLFLVTSKLSFGTAGTTYIAGVTTLAVNTWYHVAVTRSSTTVIQMFLNGVQEGSTYTASVTQNFTNNTPRIGLGANGYFNGYITNLRVIKGTASYTSTFNVPASPLTAVAGTSLLINTSAGGRIFDVSSNGFAITNNATATYSGTVTPLPGVPALRQTTAGTLEAFSEFDEFTGAPVVDTSLKLWLDSGQTASYSGTGSTWTDLSGQSNTGTLNNSPTFNSKIGGGTFLFNGTDQTATTASLNLQQDFTLEAWVNQSVLNGFAIFGQGTLSSNNGLHIWYTTATTIRFGMFSNDTDFTVSTSTGTWYHMIFTYNNSSPYTKSFYLNAVAQTGTAVSGPAAYTGSGTFRLGATYSAAGAYGNGYFEGVKMYNRILTADEITTNFNALRNRYGI